MGDLNGRHAGMNLHPERHLQLYKYHECPADHKQAVLVVDVETETVPVTDYDGNQQYFCLLCQRTFSVSKYREIIDGPGW